MDIDLSCVTKCKVICFCIPNSFTRWIRSVSLRITATLIKSYPDCVESLCTQFSSSSCWRSQMISLLLITERSLKRDPSISHSRNIADWWSVLAKSVSQVIGAAAGDVWLLLTSVAQKQGEILFLIQLQSFHVIILFCLSGAYY